MTAYAAGAMFWLWRNIVWIALRLDRPQPIVSPAEVCPEAVRVVAGGEVDVAALPGVRREGLVIVLDPSAPPPLPAPYAADAIETLKRIRTNHGSVEGRPGL